MDVEKCIRGRRSVRGFRRTEIPPKLLDHLIDALRWAPSAGNLQSRRFFFVFDPDLRRELARAAERQTFAGRAPLVVVACADHRIEREYEERGVELYSVMDVAAALQNLMLVAHAHGLATCWLGALNEDAVRKLLRLPPHLRPVSIVPVGYPSEHPTPPRRHRRQDVAVFLD
jgi:nitroreductase